MALQRLTDKTEKTSDFADDDIFHIVDVSDTTQNVAGSSYYVKFVTFLGWIASKAITFAQQITFTSAPKFSSVGPNKYLKTNASNEVVGFDVVAGNYRVVSTTQPILITDGFLDASNAITLTLPTAIGNTSKQFCIINNGVDNITINTTLSQTIGNAPSGNPTSFVLFPEEVLEVISNGTNYRII